MDENLIICDFSSDDLWNFISNEDTDEFLRFGPMMIAIRMILISRKLLGRNPLKVFFWFLFLTGFCF
jgi:hypothetical protein